MPPADTPLSDRILLVIGAGQQFAEPLDQRSLEPIDLRLATGDDPPGSRMPLDLRLKVVNEARKKRIEDRSNRLYPLRIEPSVPANVRLELSVASVKLVRVHRPQS